MWFFVILWHNLDTLLISYVVLVTSALGGILQWIGITHGQWLLLSIPESIMLTIIFALAEKNDEPNDD